ncbi:MAG: LytR/AlgR family response regulator transcription factor [Culicoidibacterales bacterium]
MKIVIYDKKISDAMKCNQQVMVHLKRRGVEHEIDIIEHQATFQFQLEEIIKEVDLIYFGINDHPNEELTLVKELREKGYEREIVFYADSEKHAITGYDVEILHYVVKKVTDRKKFENILDKAVDKFMQRLDEVLIVQCAGEVRCIEINSIKYFEMNTRIVTVYYGVDEVFEFYTTMAKLTEQLDGKGFIRVHRSYLVNKFKIIKNTKQEIIVKSGASTPHVVPVGRKYAKELIEYVQINN